MTSAFLAGALAGLGVALPMGAISVLLLQQALQHGWRSAAAGASGVALVDLAYATLAVTAGTAVTRLLTGQERVVALVGALVLTVVAVRGLLALRRPAAPVDTGPGAGPGAVPGTVPDAGAGRVLRTFVGLTAINPLTAVYFVVLAAGLGATLHGAPAASAFVVGIFLGSWAWQLTLVTLGAVAGARLPGWARTATSVLGYLVVLGYAVRLAWTS